MFQPGAAADFRGSGDICEELFTWPSAGELRPALTNLRVSPAVLQRELPRLVAVRSPAPRSAANLFDARLTRVLDIIIASAALLFFSLVMAAISLTILVTGGGPVLFRQQRLGQGGRMFGCLKFRTMRVDADRALADLLASDPVAAAEWQTSQKLQKDPRVSTIGNLLRKTSVDELPQLFNVLAGDMSIVGPRPIVAAEAQRYQRYIGAYYAVKPGITGVWQISGRNHTTYRRRVACDVHYVRTRSALRDLAIIGSTVPAVLFARGAY